MSRLRRFTSRCVAKAASADFAMTVPWIAGAAGHHDAELVAELHRVRFGFGQRSVNPGLGEIDDGDDRGRRGNDFALPRSAHIHDASNRRKHARIAQFAPAPDRASPAHCARRRGWPPPSLPPPGSAAGWPEPSAGMLPPPPRSPAPNRPPPSPRSGWSPSRRASVRWSHLPAPVPRRASCRLPDVRTVPEPAREPPSPPAPAPLLPLPGWLCCPASVVPCRANPPAYIVGRKLLLRRRREPRPGPRASMVATSWPAVTFCPSSTASEAMRP